MSELLYGSAMASEINGSLSERSRLLRESGVVPALAVVRVGEKDDDLAYEKSAARHCREAGVDVRHIELPGNTSLSRAADEIGKLNGDKKIHGILVLRPFPRKELEEKVCSEISVSKDVDGASPLSMAGVYSGSGSGFAPCTAESAIMLIRGFADPSGMRAAVVGRSLVVGRPLAALLVNSGATVTLCHSKTADLPSITKSCDIVITAVGRAEIFGPEYFREGQIVIDCGMNYSKPKGKFVGDVDFDRVSGMVSAITPVPGGVGALTASVLCRHVIEAAELSCGFRPAR